MERARAGAAVVGLVAFGAYVLTLAPELTPRVGPGAEIAFQATDPAWLQGTLARAGSADGWSPASVLVRAWAFLPQAWNLNLLSAAIAGLLAALLSIHVTEETDGAAGAGAALGFALSPVVWATAVAAAGSAATLLIAVLLLLAARALARWARTGQRSRLVLAFAALALVVADDLTVGIGGVVLAVMWSWSQGMGMASPLAWGTGSVVLGAAWQAIGLRAVLGDATGTVGQPGMLAAWAEMWRWGTSGHVLATRTSDLIGLVHGNIGVLGWVLAGLGLRASIPMLATLVVMSGAVCAGPVPGPWDGATRGVLVLVLAWGLIGLGLQRLARWVPGGHAVATALVLVLPLFQVARTYAHEAGLLDRAAGGMLLALSREVTEPTAIVADDAAAGRLQAWMNARRDAAARIAITPHDPALIAGLINDGVTVLATEAGAARLSLSGLTGPAYAVPGRAFGDVLEGIDNRALVALAAGPAAFEGHGAALAALARLTGRASVTREGRDAVALLARRSEQVAHVVTGETGVSLTAGPGGSDVVPPEVIPSGGVHLRADADGAGLELGGREAAFVEGGAVLASWSPLDGHVEWVPLDPRTGLTAPWRHDRWNLSRINRLGACVESARDGWVDILEPTAAARVGLLAPADGVVRLYLGRDRGLNLRGAVFPGRPSPVVAVDRWDRIDPGQARTADEALAADGLVLPSSASATRFVWRVTVRGSGRGADLVALGLGGSPDWAWAQLQSTAGTAIICAGTAGARLFTRDGQREDALSLGDGDSFGDGWPGLARTDTERWRETDAPESELFVRLDAGRTLEIAVWARPATPPAPGRPRISLEVNGTRMEAQAMEAGPARYVWTVPEDHWRTGTNRIVVRVLPADTAASSDANLPRLQITEVRFRR